jgi:hypothetical protein
MDFIPEQSSNSVDVPYFEDVTGDSGWQGQATTKSIETLQSEIEEAVKFLGGRVVRFQRGTFQTGKVSRDGFRVHYVVEDTNGHFVAGRIDVAALPNKDDWSLRLTIKKRKEQSLKMALYMLRVAIKGTWFLQQLSPGYSALMPWMLASGDKTISQLWGESSVMKNLLPPGEEDFVEGEYCQA